MGKFVRVKVQARVLRTIDKVGGLDEYLLGDKAARIKELGMGGWLLRWKVMQTETVQKRFRQEKMAMGLEVPSEEEVIRENEERAARKAEKQKALETERTRRVQQARSDRQEAKRPKKRTGEPEKVDPLIEEVE